MNLKPRTKRTVTDYYNGMPLKDALKGLAERVPSWDTGILWMGLLKQKIELILRCYFNRVETISDRMILNEENELRGQKVTIYALLALCLRW